MLLIHFSRRLNEAHDSFGELQQFFCSKQNLKKALTVSFSSLINVPNLFCGLLNYLIKKIDNRLHGKPTK